MQQRPARFFAQRLFEFVFVQTGLLQRETIALAVKIPVNTLERGNFHNTFAQVCVTDRQPHLVGLIVQRAQTHQTLQHGAVQTDGLRLLEAKLLAGLAFDGADLLLQLAGIIIDGDRFVAHFANGACAAVQIDRPKTAQTQDQKTHEPPYCGFRKAVAFGFHGLIP